MWDIYTMEFSTTKKNGIKQLAGKWIELENMLSEVAQAQEDKHYLFSYVDLSFKFFIYVYLHRSWRTGASKTRKKEVHEKSKITYSR